MSLALPCRRRGPPADASCVRAPHGTSASRPRPHPLAPVWRRPCRPPWAGSTSDGGGSTTASNSVARWAHVGPTGSGRNRPTILPARPVRLLRHRVGNLSVPAGLVRRGAAVLAGPVARRLRRLDAPESVPMCRGDPATVWAGREANNACGIAADVAKTGPGQLANLLDVHVFGLEQRLFHLRTEDIVADRSVRAGYPVTRDQQWNGVARKGRTDCTYGSRPADLAGQPGVRPDLALRNRECCAQHRLLEVGRVPQVESQATGPSGTQRRAKSSRRPLRGEQRPGEPLPERGGEGRVRTVDGRVGPYVGNPFVGGRNVKVTERPGDTHPARGYPIE